MIGLIISVLILLLSLFLLLCSYYNMEDDINELPNSFIIRYFCRLISCNKILSNVHPIVYFITGDISFLASVVFILILVF